MNPQCNLENTDWNTLWNTMTRARHPGKDDPEAWNQKASGFARRARSNNYTSQLLNLLDVDPGETLLDVGCGEGSVTIPVARRVRKVTAMDYSNNMLELLNKNASKERVENITTLLAGWEDPWESLRLPGGSEALVTHDVSLVSRAFLVRNLDDAIGKLNRFTRRKVHVVTMGGAGAGGTISRRAAGRPENPAPEAIIAINRLHQMGIRPELRYIRLEHKSGYSDPQEAFEWFCKSLKEITPEEKKRVQAFLDQHLVQEEGGWFVHPRTPVEWALITWTPPAKGADKPL